MGEEERNTYFIECKDPNDKYRGKAIGLSCTNDHKNLASKDKHDIAIHVYGDESNSLEKDVFNKFTGVDRFHPNLK